MCRHRCLFCYVLSMSSRSRCHPTSRKWRNVKRKMNCWNCWDRIAQKFWARVLCCFSTKTKFNQSQRLRVNFIQLECVDADGPMTKWIKYLYVWFLIAKRLRHGDARCLCSWDLFRLPFLVPIRITRKIVLRLDGISQSQPGNSDISIFFNAIFSWGGNRHRSMAPHVRREMC